MSRRPQPVRRTRPEPAAPGARVVAADARADVAARPASRQPRVREPSGASVVALAARAGRGRLTVPRPPRRVAVAAAVAVVLVVGLAWVVLASPLLALRHVDVTGTERLDPAQVRAVVDREVGTPLARLDTGELAQRVQELPLVGDVDVLRSWPRGLEVRVVERQPVAVVRTGGAGDAGVTLVDGEGRRLLGVPEAPVDLPELTAATERAGAGAVGAAVAVLQQMPPELRAQVATTEARTADSVTLTLRSGATVVWGGAADSAQKAEVLAVLLKQPADVYDVSAPRTPVLR